MGKRKERRLAALGGGGRRVKLDLFAEPSGDAVGSTVNHEVTGGHEQNGRPVVPVSPSSGTQPDGSLSLLGQYSDSDLVEEVNETAKYTSGGDASDACITKAEDIPSVHENSKALVADAGNMECSNSDVAAARITANDLVRETLEIVNADDCSTNPSLEQEVSGNSAAQIVGDVANGWKLVMHEESNQYYYWNTITGETSWEVPHVLLEGSEKNEISVPEGSETVTLNITNSDQNERSSYGQSNASGDDSLLDTMDAVPFAGRKCEDGFAANMMATVCDSHSREVLNIGVSTQMRYNTIGEGNYATDYGSITNSKDKEFNLPGFEEDLPARLVKQGENLLQRLHALNESDESVKKCIMEAEIRLSDCKVLSPYGPALLPLWSYMETQFKRLEYVIPSSEILQSAKFELPNNVKGAHEVSQDEVNDRENRGLACSGEEPVSSQQIEPLIQENGDELPINDFSVSVSEHVCCQDVDMDVDMEVDDESNLIQGNTEDAETLVSSTSSKLPVPSDYLPKSESVVPAENPGAPPPCEEDWIPPPPPDDEPPPPPPPPPPSDEPMVVSYSLPAPYTQVLPSQVLPSVPFDGYNISYSGTGYEYYGTSLSEVSSSSYFAPLEGSQIADLNQLYYGQASLFPTPTLAIANPVVSTDYYDYPSGNFPSENVNSAIDYSGINGDVKPFEPDKVKVDVVESSGASVVHETSELTANMKSDSHISVSEPAIVTPLENNSSADLQGISTKNQPKVTRTKKRTLSMAPSLRANKKVSSLVDKWKAAKEELKEEEEEDEPENSYEVLEKKKQREIEEWRAQQISSGQALENANFQPLGGDWRERVKRRRVEKNKSKSDVVQDLEPVSNGKLVSNGKPEPNLVELSKSLPSGWQACWDEQTKKVYYANLLTSKTTWTRPT